MQENIKQVIVKNTVRKEFKTAPIFQWDTGHVLIFEGFNLPEAFQVHFAFSESGESVPQIGSNDQVTVPDALVEDGRMIYAWLYISTEDAGLTKFVILMPVNRRAKPTHQVPPPVEHSEIEQAIVVLNAAVVKAETSAENAEQSEENASQYADNAYNSSVAAANAAESAEGDASTATAKAQEAITAALDASESAQLASQKASEASGYADGLAEAVRTANEAKQTAVNKATEANQSATNAAQKAQEALSSAQAAEGSANDADTAKRGAETAKEAAQGYAGNASASAETAVVAKNTAVEKAGEASQSATNAAQSAQAAQQTAAQFEEDITQLKSDIESKQDAPSVAGTAGQVLGLDAQLHPVWVDQTGGTVDDSALAPVIKNSASGEIASFADGADNRLIDSLTVNIEPKQEGSGDASPDNVRPISGWTGANIVGAGQNLFDPNTLGREHTTSGNTIVTAESNRSVRIPAIPGVTYTMSADKDGTNGAIAVAVLDSSGAVIQRAGSTTVSSVSITANNSAVTILGSINNIDNFTNIQLDHGSSTPTDYKPYSGATISVDWTDEAGTVYGGKLDIVSGDLAVDRTTIDLASLTWTAYGTVGTNRRVGSNVLPNVLAPSANNVKGDFITEQYKTVVYSQLDFLDFSQIALTPTGTLTLGFDDVNYPSGKICYKLAEPIVYHLSPNEVRTLLGQNNIFADCGSIESVEYSADTKLYIDNKITAAVAAALNS